LTFKAQDLMTKILPGGLWAYPEDTVGTVKDRPCPQISNIPCPEDTILPPSPEAPPCPEDTIPTYDDYPRRDYPGEQCPEDTITPTHDGEGKGRDDKALSLLQAQLRKRLDSTEARL
jgi:hypothetical protein